MLRHRKGVVATAAAVLALGLAACGGGDDDGSTAAGTGTAAAGEASAGKAAMIGVAPVTQGNWDPPGYQAFTKMAETYGYEPSNQESVGYDQAAAVLRRLARDNDLVISHSSGYEAAVLEVAPDFPDTSFVVFSDLSTTNGLPNLAGWAINWNEYGYLAGAAACLAAKERGGDGVGHVNSQPIPAFTRYAAGVKQATEDNGCTFQTRWTNDFSDVAKAKQAALSMIADGAEVITSSADTADEGSRDGAVEQDKLFVANYSPAPELEPEHTLTTVVINMDQAFDEMGKLHSEGQLEPEIHPMNVENGSLTYDAFANVPDSVAEQAQEILEQIKSGEIQVDSEAELKP